MITGCDLMSTQYFISYSFLFWSILINFYVYTVENRLEFFEIQKSYLLPIVFLHVYAILYS